MKIAMTIAGSDSSAGAGIQADLKTFTAFGVYGTSVITSVTSQNSRGVDYVENLSVRAIGSQIDSIFSDMKVDAVKIGMIPNRESAKTIIEKLSFWSSAIRDFPPIVYDPVMISTSGRELMDGEAIKYIAENLFPLCNIITPNIPEAEKLTRMKISSEEKMILAAKKLLVSGPEYVLVKGGHLKGEAIDILYDGNQIVEFRHKRIEGKSPHGTGCTLSSAIAANLANGYDMISSVERAKEYISEAIEKSLTIGGGDPFLDHSIKIK